MLVIRTDDTCFSRRLDRDGAEPCHCGRADAGLRTVALLYGSDLSHEHGHAARAKEARVLSDRVDDGVYALGALGAQALGRQEQGCLRALRAPHKSSNFLKQPFFLLVSTIRSEDV
jgi:hypothetical protein